MDLPLFGDADSTRRREINLGGSRTPATTHNDIVHQAKLRRLQRDEYKRRQDAAARIQNSWSAYLARCSARRTLRLIFEQDLSSLTALRALVLLGQDEDALARWSATVVPNRESTGYFLQCDQSWLVLFQRVSRMLLLSLSANPTSAYALVHLDALNALLATNPHHASVARYLLAHRFYPILRNIIIQFPVPAAKQSPLLSPLITLVTAPCSYPDLLCAALRDLVSTILPIPLLPNRLLPVLAPFVANLPLAHLDLVPADVTDYPELSSIEPKVHLLANLAAFMPPRYPSLPTHAFITYLRLVASLMNALPTHALEPPEDKPEDAKNWVDSDSDDESEIQVVAVASFEPKPQLPQLDDKTRKRLQTFPSSDHVHTLLHASQKPALLLPIVFLCFALITVWPSRQDKVLSSIVAYNRSSLVREIYREYVRSSPLGRGDSYNDITKAEHATHWPPLLLLSDLYTQALLTMGDDEFFSSGTNLDVSRNPLTLDELTVFSRKILNIAFALYWREDPSTLREPVPGLGQVTWEHVREKTTKCLQALHARDSRRPFTSPDHWLLTSHVDMTSFIQAAIHEEKQLSQPETGRPSALTKRQIAYLSPRLGVLNNIPFAIPFDVRVGIFREFVVNDMQSRGFSASRRRMGTTNVTIRRAHIAQDGFDKLGELDLKAPMSITFIDQFGQEEAGIDGGGVFKEFLTSLCREVFDTDRGLWQANTRNELYPLPSSYATERHSLAWYRFIGRILGKALYEGILVDVAFAGFFLAKWLGKQSWLDDLASLDPQLYQGLIFLKHYKEDPLQLSLNFTVAEEEFGETKSTDLIPNGSNISVTRENRLQYIYMVAHFRLTKQIKKQSEAFFEGLSEIIDPKWLRMFNQQELQILLGGVNLPIDLEDLRAHTQYGGLYNDHEYTIQLFWQVVNSFGQEDRRKLLRFATSCGRPPLLGFKELNPNFAIRDSSADENRLPTASTCVNLLKLPRYKNAAVMRDKLLQAINANAGFDLS